MRRRTKVLHPEIVLTRVKQSTWNFSGLRATIDKKNIFNDQKTEEILELIDKKSRNDACDVVVALPEYSHLSNSVGQMPDGHPIPDSKARMNHSLKDICPSVTGQLWTSSWLAQDILTLQQRLWG